MKKENDVIIGGINFGPEENIVRIDTFKIDFDKALKDLNEGQFIPYFDLLRLMTKNVVDNIDLSIIDNENNIWNYDIKTRSFIDENMEDPNFLTDFYEDAELPNLMVQKIKQCKEKKISKGKQDAIKAIENLYMDLEMSIDNCQGCMDGLDEAFDEIATYKEVLKFLGVDTNKDSERRRLVDEWYEKRKAEEKEEELNRNELFDDKLTLTRNISMIMSNDPKDELLVNVVNKVNDILKYLKKNS